MKCPKCMQTIKDGSTECEYCESPIPSSILNSSGTDTKEPKKNFSWLKKLFNKK